MNVATPAPHGTLDVVADPASRSRLSRLARAGRAIRLAPGLYALGATLPPEQVARHHLLAIIGATWPAAVLFGRTALAGSRPIDGLVFVSHPDPPRRTPLHLPGFDIVPVVGPGPLPGDMALPEGLWSAGPARVLVENVDLRGRPARHRAGTALVEDRMDELARSGGPDRIRTVLGQLDVIAASFDRVAVHGPQAPRPVAGHRVGVDRHELAASRRSSCRRTVRRAPH